MKKKILQVITRSDWAGGQKVLYALVYGFKKYYPDAFEIQVACGKDSGMLVPELEKLGVKVHIVENLVREISPVKDAKALFELVKLLKHGNYDVVHLHSSKAGFLGRLAARVAGVPKVIYTVHGWWSIEQYRGLKRKLFMLAEKIAAEFCDRIVFLCKQDMDKARKWRIGSEEKYAVVPNAIIPFDSSRFRRGKLRDELGIPEGIKIVGNVARLDRPKNPLRFLEVAEQVLNVREDVRFVWVGGNVVEDTLGPVIGDWLKNHPREAKYIHFLPFRRDALELLADFDAFLLTSDAEGMPLALLEAKSLGVPVFSMRVGCITDQEGILTANTTAELSRLLLENLDRLSEIKKSIAHIGERTEREFLQVIESYRNLYLCD